MALKAPLAGDFALLLRELESDPLLERYDGISVNLNDRGVRYRDNNLEARWLTYIVGPTGAGLALDYLPFLRDTALGARASHKQLKWTRNTRITQMNADSISQISEFVFIRVFR